MPLLPDSNFEKNLLPKKRFILGIDEAGRGPWAGSVYAAAFLLDLKNFNLDFFLENKIRDSKTLSQKQRENAVEKIREKSYPFSVAHATAKEIDKLGILNATKLAIHRAIKPFLKKAEFILIDGNMSFELSLPYESIIKGDQKAYSIATASILAKVYRDKKMEKLDKDYPQYGFAQHKGYGTKQHQKALREHGPCPFHRFSYRPIRKLSSLT